MNKKLLYKIAYRKLMYFTPLKFDCGVLCDRYCCKGTEEKGMQLYPGEVSFMSSAISDFKIKEETFTGIKTEFAICIGKCNRQDRPLACRIYPLVPYITLNNNLVILEDPRARYHCPLIMPGSDISINRFFIRRAIEAFNLLIKDPDIYAYIFAMSRVLDDYSRFTR